ncbi:hypothetical protein [Desulfatirhabdium butyrativorans]|uniref:hypothetical protein n=1 Tax=Desulfatirhabdium butyrativorans TaxID=340467 RepID=UPI0004158976|nr:hypothetical protein [Desulfatirhabdium butyrativorans]
MIGYPAVILAKTGVTSLGNLDYDYDYDNDNDNDNDYSRHYEERDLDDDRPCNPGFTPVNESRRSKLQKMGAIRFLLTPDF